VIETVLTERELAQRSGATSEFVAQLVGLGILPARDDDRPFRPSDIHRVRLAQAFEQSGIPLEAIGKAIAAGELSFGFVDHVFIYDTPLTGKTFREIAEELGVSLEVLTRLYPMWGLPRPGPDDVIREDDAPTFSEWKAFLPPEALNERLLLQGARLFGETARRLAEWGFELYKEYMQAPLLASGMSRQEAINASSAFAAMGIPMMERQFIWLLRRHIEHNTFQLIVEHVENAVEAAGAAPTKAAKPPAIAFVDLSGYTAMTEEIGDQAAAERAAALATLIQELAHAHGGTVVKLLGDGAMLHFPDPGEGVLCGLELVEWVEKAGLPPARAGIAAGPVVVREGDCYGRVVNVAARVMDKAKPREVLVTPEVVSASNGRRSSTRSSVPRRSKGWPRTSYFGWLPQLDRDLIRVRSRYSQPSRVLEVPTALHERQNEEARRGRAGHRHRPSPGGARSRVVG
jgi:adenylate cyclase